MPSVPDGIQWAKIPMRVRTTSETVESGSIIHGYIIQPIISGTLARLEPNKLP